MSHTGVGTGASIFPAWWVRGGAASTLLTGLTHYWPLNEESGTREDVVGSFDLTDNNTVGFAPGISGNAAQCVTANSENLTSNVLTALPESGSSFTLSYWVYRTSGGGGSNYAIYALDSTTGFYGIHGGAAGNFSVRGGGSTATTANALMGDNAWVHVVCGWNAATQKPFLYTNNGTLVTSAGTVAYARLATFTFRIDVAGTQGINALYDEVAMWNTRVLSSDERTELYAAGAGKFYPF